MLEQKIIISTQLSDQFKKLKCFLNENILLMNIPMIEIKTIEANHEIFAALNQIKNYNWVIFTSMRGIQSFFGLWGKSGLTSDLLQNIKFASIGHATNEELNKFGFNATYINPGNTSKEFSKYLINDVLKKEDNVLLPLGERADTYLPDALGNFCSVNRINVYQTIDIKYLDKKILRLIERDAYDLLVFTSPSAFENFISLSGFKSGGTDLKIATIGNRTAESVKKSGFKVKLIPEKSTLESLAAAISEYSHLQSSI